MYPPVRPYVTATHGPTEAPRPARRRSHLAAVVTESSSDAAAPYLRGISPAAPNMLRARGHSFCRPERPPRRGGGERMVGAMITLRRHATELRHPLNLYPENTCTWILYRHEKKATMQPAFQVARDPKLRIGFWRFRSFPSHQLGSQACCIIRSSGRYGPYPHPP